jgi:hypothetical protein
MLRNFLRQIILSRIEERGRAEGAPTVTFTEKEIFAEGDEMNIGRGWTQWYFLISGFYLALPHNAYGVVVHPNGRLENMQGGLHEAPAGLYRVFYVDKQERSAVSSPVSEITTDGEKLTLKIIVRYHVQDPVVALGITNPVDTMMEHIETDVAQYIRTHHHTEIADAADTRDSRLLSFFTDRHTRRDPLAKAIEILGVELKEFMGDKEFVDMRRRERTESRQAELTRLEEEQQQEISRIKAQFKADSDRWSASLTAELNRQAAEQKAQIETLEARYRREKEEILRQVYEQEIELKERGQRWDRLNARYIKAFEAISQAVTGGFMTNPAAAPVVEKLLDALNKELRGGEPPAPAAGAADDGQAAGKQAAPTPEAGGQSEVDKLTKTLLDLLKPKK